MAIIHGKARVEKRCERGLIDPLFPDIRCILGRGGAEVVQITSWGRAEC